MKRYGVITLAAALLVLPSLIIYGQFLDSPIFFDDLGLNDWLRMPPEGAAFQLREAARLLTLLNTAVGGSQVTSLRIGNLLLHLCTALMLWGVARQLLLTDRRTDVDPASATWLAFGAALLFSVHPVAAYATGYVVQRTILLATFFALAATWLHVRGHISGRSWYWPAAVVCYALSVFSKEHSILLPAALAIINVWAWRAGHPWRRQWSWVFLAYAVIAVLILELRRSAVGPGEIFERFAVPIEGVTDYPYLSSLVSQMLFFFEYLGLWLLPYTRLMSIDMQYALPGIALPWLVVPAPVLFVTLLVVAVRLLLRGALLGVVGVILLWAAVLFGTELWAVRLSESFVLYRSYLWMLFLPLLVVLAIHGIAARLVADARQRLAAVATVVVLVGGGYAYGLVDRLQSMSTPLKLWQDAVDKNDGTTWPGAARSYTNLGVFVSVAGDADAAQRYFLRSLKHNPRWAPGYCNLINHHVFSGEGQLAREILRYAMAKEIRDPCVDRMYWLLLRRGLL